MADAVKIGVGSAAELGALREVFLALHAHHRTVSSVVVTDPDERAWHARVATYERHFADGNALLHVARTADRVAGYAFTVLHPGSDDTFPLGAGYAELYTLAVLRELRGSGIGSRLMDAVDAELSGRGIGHLVVAVMAGNDAAIRFYQRRGLVPGELTMYRIASPDR